MGLKYKVVKIGATVSNGKGLEVLRKIDTGEVECCKCADKAKSIINVSEITSITAGSGFLWASLLFTEIVVPIGVKLLPRCLFSYK